MIKTIHHFTGFSVGDIATLSDLQTQSEYGQMSVDFVIRESRTYTEPNGVFKYHGYLIEAPNHDIYMLLIKAIKDLFEVYIYFKDVGASGLLFHNLPGQEPCCPLLGLFTEDLEDMVTRFEANVTDASGTHPVTWDRQTSSYGIQLNSSLGGEGMCSLGEYYTADENGGNNYCLLDWKGSTSKGYIETWYGCRVIDDEVSLHRAN